MSQSTTSSILQAQDPQRLSFAPTTVGVITLTAPLTAPPEEDAPTKMTTPCEMISSSMSQADIVSVLIRHNCPDISPEIDLPNCSREPCNGGGWGDVYQGRLNGGQPIAIKCTRIFLSSRAIPGFLKNAAKELYAWSKCRHDNVQELLGLALYHGQIAMVSPWMNEGNLMEYIAAHREVNRLEACTQIATGLDYLHGLEQEIVHGDIKGENVLVGSDGTFKLTDFGSALIKSHSVRFSSLHKNGEAAGNGTVRWSAPEIINNSPNSSETDIYALGMTILEIITGEIPFAGLNERAVYAKLLMVQGPPDRPKCCFPHDEGGDKIWSLLNQCWAVDATTRPSASDVKARLKPLELNHSTPQAFDHGLRDSIFPICGYTPE